MITEEEADRTARAVITAGLAGIKPSSQVPREWVRDPQAMVMLYGATARIAMRLIGTNADACSRLTGSEMSPEKFWELFCEAARQLGVE